jgi:hypothetical protein
MRIVLVATVDQVRFINQAQSAGLALDDIQHLAVGQLRRNDGPSCGKVPISPPGSSRMSTGAARNCASSVEAACAPRYMRPRPPPNPRAQPSRPWMSPRVGVDVMKHCEKRSVFRTPSASDAAEAA